MRYTKDKKYDQRDAATLIVIYDQPGYQICCYIILPRHSRMDKSVFVETEKKKVEVNLLGQKLALKTNKDQEYLQKLADFVADQISEVKKGSRSISAHQSVLLIAIKLADMLKEREDELFEIKDMIRKKASLALDDVESALGELRAEQQKQNEPTKKEAN